jgi:hypothetical protein
MRKKKQQNRLSKEYQVIVQGKVSKAEKMALEAKVKAINLTSSAWIRREVRRFINK